MSVMSLSCCALLSAVCAFTLVSAAGCGTDAQGVDECRQIEETRCVAAKNCGIVSDIPDCQRYYRSQCLHGLPVPPPGSAKLTACLDMIRAAGACAQSSGVDTLLDDCDPSLSSSAADNDLKTTCDLVKEPEKTAECSFLTGSSGGAGGGSNSEGKGGRSSEAAEGGQGGSSGAAD